MDVEGRATQKIEEGEEKGSQNDDSGLATAHTIDRGNSLYN